MTQQTLQSKLQSYENPYDYSILSKIPVVIKLDGRFFSKIVDNIQKPFDLRLKSLFNKTMLNLVKQIDNVVFGYQYSDKIILILKTDKDQSPWYGNKIQQMASASASIATYEFITALWEMDEVLPLNGKTTFLSYVFGLPDYTETINYLIWRQYLCVQHTINEYVLSLVKPKYGDDLNSIIHSKKLEDKKQMLLDAGINYDDIPIIYKNGTGAYLTPSLVNTSGGQVTRHKWTEDYNLPIFFQNRDFISTILKNGSDIFRPERDL